MSKLIVEVKNELLKDLKHQAIDLEISLRLLVIALLDDE